MKHIPLGLSLLALLTLGAGCGDGGSTSASTGSGGAGGSSTTSGSLTTTGSGGAGGSGSTTSAGGGTSSTATGTSTSTASGTTTSSTSTGAGGGAMVADPNLDGPFAITEIDDTYSVAGADSNIPVHAAYPTAGPTAGPYPVIVIAHGFQLPPSQYYGYAKRLASFGYVAVAPDFPTQLAAPTNTANAQDLIGSLDWAAQKLSGKADTTTAGATGHSLGGKLAVLAAELDARFKATIVLDPVDGAVGNPLDPNPMCTPPACVQVNAMLPISKPTGFIGETTDSTAGGFGSACAPAAENYTTFYAKTTAPSLSVTALGANHMSFLDNVATCGFTCSFCKMATAPNAQVNGMAKAFVVAFYERYLRNDAGYDTYLTGAQAQARYVTTNQATIASK